MHTKLLEIINKSYKEISQISEENMAFKATPERWSKKEILGHLIDSGINNYQRFLLGQNTNNLTFGGYDQVEWVKANNYQNKSTKETLDIWHAINLHISNLVEEIPAEKLNKETTEHNFHQVCMKTVELGKPSTLAYLINDYIFHLEHHVKQIVSL